MHTIWKRMGVGLALGLVMNGPAAWGEEMWVYFGTYTGAKSRGIYVSRFDAASGKLAAPELAAETQNPSFLALHPGGRHLYSVGELGQVDGRPGGAVVAFERDSANGRLTRLNQESSKGGGPCHLVVDRTGRWVLLANYGGGNVAVLPIRPDGSLGAATCVVQHEGRSVNAQRQGEPHAHSINLDAANRVAIAADLGTDKLMIYRFDAETGLLTAGDPAFAASSPGSGPRHFAFHPDGRRAFAINELLSTLTAYRYEPETGALWALTTVTTLPDGKPVAGNSTAEVQVHPSGKFVYGSNRGHDSIAVFRIEGDGGGLVWVENEPTQGRVPRNFGIDPTGRWLLAANQGSNSVVVFAIDPATGELTPNGERIEVGTPVCVKFAAKSPR